MEEKKKGTKKNSSKKTSGATKKKVVTPKKEAVVKEKVEKKNTQLITENGRINNLSILIQAVLTTYAVLLLIGGLFHNLFLELFDAVASILFFTIAYNNNKIFKRKYFTTIYIIAGILFAGIFIFQIFN